MATNSSEYKREYYAKNKDKFKKYRETFREKHGPKILSDKEKANQKEYLSKYNKEKSKILNEKKRIRLANKSEEEKQKLRAKKKEWRDKNKGYMNEYNKNRKANDATFKLRMYLRSRVNKAIRGLIKQGSAVKDLGCSIVDFKNFIENKFDPLMTWDNYGEWELDHIKPLAKFDLTIKKQFDEACHYTNYQPLWKIDNRRKRDK